MQANVGSSEANGEPFKIFPIFPSLVLKHLNTNQKRMEIRMSGAPDIYQRPHIARGSDLVEATKDEYKAMHAKIAEDYLARNPEITPVPKKFSTGSDILLNMKANLGAEWNHGIFASFEDMLQKSLAQDREAERPQEQEKTQEPDRAPKRERNLERELQREIEKVCSQGMSR
jgi:hypothetical protein